MGALISGGLAPPKTIATPSTVEANTRLAVGWEGLQPQLIGRRVGGSDYCTCNLLDAAAPNAPFSCGRDCALACQSHVPPSQGHCARVPTSSSPPVLEPGKDLPGSCLLVPSDSCQPSQQRFKASPGLPPHSSVSIITRHEHHAEIQACVAKARIPNGTVRCR